MIDERPTEHKTAVDSGSCGENLTWALDSSGVLTISGSGAMSDYPVFRDTPWFNSNPGVTSVKLLSGVTSVGDGAFRECATLREIEICGTVTRIGNGAFRECVSLENAVIPEGVTVIDDLAFSACKCLRTVTIGGSVKVIGLNAFHDCTRLDSVTFEGDAPVIARNAFEKVRAAAYYPARDPSWTRDCRKNYGGSLRWKSFAAPGARTSSETSFVKACGDNLYWYVDGGKLVICGSGAMYDYSVGSTVPWDAYSARIRSVVINRGITNIGSCAFWSCLSLTEVKISGTVTGIGSGAFENCRSLKSVVIPGSVTDIGDLAFGGCTNLSFIVFEGNAPVMGDSVFRDVRAEAYYPSRNLTWTEAVRMDYGGTVQWKSSEPEKGSPARRPRQAQTYVCGTHLTGSLDESGELTISGTSLMSDFPGCGDVPWFSRRSGILSAVIEYGAVSIGSHAFSGCANMINIAIPESVIKIGGWAFESCKSLRSVTIPDGVKSIGLFAFSECGDLETVTFGRGIEEIANYVFSGCGNLDSVTFLGSAPYFSYNVFSDMSLVVRYPAQDPTWTESVRQDYGGSVRWEAFQPEGEDPVREESRPTEKEDSSAQGDPGTDSSPDSAEPETGERIARMLAENPDALSDRAKLDALLRGLMPQEKRVCRTLMNAFDEGIVEELRTKKTADTPEIERYKNQLTEGYGISEPVAGQTIDLWMAALGVEKV